MLWGDGSSAAGSADCCLLGVGRGGLRTTHYTKSEKKNLTREQPRSTKQPGLNAVSPFGLCSEGREAPGKSLELAKNADTLQKVCLLAEVCKYWPELKLWLDLKKQNV